VNDLKTLLDIGVPPVKIAASLGVSRQSVYHWQHGHKAPSQGHALKLALLVAEMRARLSGQPGLTVR
jgi:DNA-binding transcriptional regulator YiaG